MALWVVWVAFLPSELRFSAFFFKGFLEDFSTLGSHFWLVEEAGSLHH